MPFLNVNEQAQKDDASYWIECVLQEQVFSAGSFEQVLRDGQVLCRLMNAIQPGSIKVINKSGGSFKFMNNIEQFLHAVSKYGVPEVDLFQTVDLFEFKGIHQVLNCITALGTAAYNHPEYNGPKFGPKPQHENVRNFTEDQLRAGEGIIGGQAGYTGGASQSGQNFGNARHIIFWEGKEGDTQRGGNCQ